MDSRTAEGYEHRTKGSLGCQEEAEEDVRRGNNNEGEKG